MADRALQAELFQLYFDQVPTYLQRLRDSLSGGEARGWAEGCHGIKGTARTLGLLALASVAAEAEASAPSSGRLTQLEQRLEEAKAAADAYLRVS